MADTKITDMSENTTVASTDLLEIVDDPGGSPASQKATVANVVAAGIAATLKLRQIVFQWYGDLEVGEHQGMFVNHFGFPLTFVAAYLDCKTAPGTQAIIADVHKDGATIFTNQDHRPEIAASATVGDTTTFDVATLADGEALVPFVDQVGSGPTGADLTLTLLVTE